MDSKKDIFKTISHNRPEWLAQGILISALKHNKAFQRFFAGQFNKKGINFDDVKEEYPTDIGWRTDVRVGRNIRLELKLNATLSKAQRKAIQEGKVTALVVREMDTKDHEKEISKIGGKARRTKILTWNQLARECDCPFLKELIKIANYADSIIIPKISKDTCSAQPKCHKILKK